MQTFNFTIIDEQSKQVKRLLEVDTDCLETAYEIAKDDLFDGEEIC